MPQQNNEISWDFMKDHKSAASLFSFVNCNR